MLWALMTAVWAKTITLSTPHMGKFTVEQQGRGKSAVIFVHDAHEDARNMKRLADLFASPKMRTVYFDLPGSGERAEEEALHPFMHIEVQTIILYLQAKGVKDIQCVGSGLGAILCMQALSESTPLSQIAILGPVNTKYHQSLFSNLKAYPQDHPILVISSQDRVAELCIARLEEEHEVLLYLTDGYQRGTRLIVIDPSLEKPLRDWVWKKIPVKSKSPKVNIEHETKVTGRPLPF